MTSLVSGLKYCTLHENTLGGEPEKDANTALTELDRGLRSSNMGEQMEAIVSFPKLFERYPFPILINSSFLKLSDVFHDGRNELKLFIVKVCQYSEKHLDKIINVDEFVARIFSVTHSNDPVARGMALRLLGSIARIIPERQNVHHSIRCSLESHNAKEIEAAIYAATQFAAQSKTFAISVCNKISHMIQGLNTPVEMKLGLIPILQHMHHDTATAAIVRMLCGELLLKYPAQDFVLVTLKTSTQLAATTLVDIPEQVNLLMNYVANEPRLVIRDAALSHLLHLANLGSHYWPESAVSTLIDVAASAHMEKLLNPITSILIVLTRSPAICHTYRSSDSPLMKLCYEMSYSNNLTLSGKAVVVITQIACYCCKLGELDSVEQNVDHLEWFLMQLKSIENVDGAVVENGLENAVNLCYVKKELCSRFGEFIVSELKQNTNYPVLSLCKSLCSISALKPSCLRTLLPAILKFTKEICTNVDTMNAKIKVILFSIILQINASKEETEAIKNTLNSVLKSTDYWSCYKIARSAARYGQFYIAERITSVICNSASSEHFYFWLTGIRELSIAELHLTGQNASDPPLTRLANAVTSYSKAISDFKASITPNFTLSFQMEFVRIRCEMLQSIYQLVTTCNNYYLYPTPAIYSANFKRSSMLEMPEHIQASLTERAKELRRHGDTLWKLYRHAFNADPLSLLNIQALQHICAFLAASVEAITKADNVLEAPILNADLEEGPLEIQLMLDSCRKAAQLKKMAPDDVDANRIECLKGQISLVAFSPMYYPIYFFQALQSTAIALSISPNGDPYTVPSGTHLTIKVEGVLTHHPGLFRSISAVILTATSLFVKPALDNKASDAKTVLSESVAPHRDFITSEFLVGFPVGGLYQITIEAAYEDNNNFIWLTDVRSVLNVKVHEDRSRFM